MQSGSVELSGSPRKRTLSRGVSEDDQSLRNIINKETENSARRVTRSDSRGTLKRRSESLQSEQDDLIMGLPEMMDLQTGYEEVVQELRGLEVGREVLLFQVDVLREALEGAEETLAEAQREAGQANMELERERETNAKLEDMVRSLEQEVERLREERTTIPAVPVYPLVREQEGQDNGPASPEENDHMNKATVEHMENAPSREAACPQDAAPSVGRLESIALDSPTKTSTGGGGRPPPLGDARLGSSVDLEDVKEDRGGPLSKLQRMVTKTFGQMPSLALGSPPAQDGVLQSPGGSQTEDGCYSPSDQGKDTDSISAYEDACAETPELENVFPGSGDDAGSTAEEEEEEDGEEGDPTNISQTTGPESRNPNESCVMS